MGVIDGRRTSRVPITPSDDEATPEIIINDYSFRVEDGGTTDDGASEVEQESGSDLGRIQLLASRSGRFRRRKPAVPVNLTPQPKRSQRGSKKFRRYENQLELLKECDENELEEISIEDLRGENTARTFSRILLNFNDDSMLELWSNCNNDEPEQVQENQSPKKHYNKFNNVEFNADEKFHGICRKLRLFLKQRHFPLGVMESLEEGLIDFFCNRPQDTFEITLDGFRRSMIHALCQYSGTLRSHSIKNKDGKENAKKIRVLPSEEPFSPPPVRLTVYLESKRKPQVVFS